MNRVNRVVMAAVVAGLAGAAAGQSTAFTYQGVLHDAGGPANGSYDLRLRMWDAAQNGGQVGSTLCADNVPVVDGRFTVTVDFGQQFVSPAPRYIELEVRRDTGLNCSNLGGFILLAPRQPITAAPIANHAKSAFALDAADGSPANAVVVDGAGNVGVGLAAPQAVLHVAAPTGGAAPGEGLRIRGSGPGIDNLAYASFYNAAGGQTGYVGDGSAGDNTVFLASTQGDVSLITLGGRVLTANADGSVRLGTASGDYRRLTVGGGNSDGFLYGSFPRYGDGVHLGYNYYANAAGGDQVIHPDGGTSRMTVGYGQITFAASPAFGGAPVDRAYVDSTGLRVPATTRYYSVHGSAFVPNINSSSGAFGYYDEYGMSGYGTGTNGFTAPVELPHGATITRFDVMYEDSNTNTDMTVTLGRVALGATGGPVALGSVTSSGSSAGVRTMGTPVGAVVDNASYAYYLRGQLFSFGGSLHRIVGVRITYTVTSPLP